MERLRFPCCLLQLIEKIIEKALRATSWSDPFSSPSNHHLLIINTFDRHMAVGPSFLLRNAKYNSTINYSSNHWTMNIISHLSQYIWSHWTRDIAILGHTIRYNDNQIGVWPVSVFVSWPQTALLFKAKASDPLLGSERQKDPTVSERKRKLGKDKTEKSM